MKLSETAVRCPGCGESVVLPVRLDMVRVYDDRVSTGRTQQYMHASFDEVVVLHDCGKGGE